MIRCFCQGAQLASTEIRLAMPDVDGIKPLTHFARKDPLIKGCSFARQAGWRSIGDSPLVIVIRFRNGVCKEHHSHFAGHSELATTEWQKEERRFLEELISRLYAKAPLKSKRARVASQQLASIVDSKIESWAPLSRPSEPMIAKLRAQYVRRPDTWIF
jgi:hypothetical protein